MTAERDLAAMRAARDAARASFKGRLGRARVDLAPAAVKQRLVAEAKVKAMEVASEAIEIANDSRGVVVATGAALALWLARKPIGRAARRAWDNWQPAASPGAGTLASAGDWLFERWVARFGRKPGAESVEDSNDE